MELLFVLKTISMQQGINMIDIISKTGKGKTTIFRYLNILKDINLIEYRGSRKTGGYYLTDKAKEILK